MVTVRAEHVTETAAEHGEGPMWSPRWFLQCSRGPQSDELSSPDSDEKCDIHQCAGSQG